MLPDADPVADLLKAIDEFELVAPRGDVPAPPDLTELSNRAAEANRTRAQIKALMVFEDDSQVLAATRAEAERDVMSAEMRKMELEEELGACPTCQREFEPGALELGAAARKRGW